MINRGKERQQQIDYPRLFNEVVVPCIQKYGIYAVLEKMGSIPVTRKMMQERGNYRLVATELLQKSNSHFDLMSDEIKELVVAILINEFILFLKHAVREKTIANSFEIFLNNAFFDFGLQVKEQYGTSVFNEFISQLFKVVYEIKWLYTKQFEK